MHIIKRNLFFSFFKNTLIYLLYYLLEKIEIYLG